MSSGRETSVDLGNKQKMRGHLKVNWLRVLFVVGIVFHSCNGCFVAGITFQDVALEDGPGPAEEASPGGRENPVVQRVIFPDDNPAFSQHKNVENLFPAELPVVTPVPVEEATADLCSLGNAKVMYNGICVSFFSEGPPICEPGNWLVMIPSEHGGMAGCRSIPCPDPARNMLGRDGNCHSSEDLEKTCKEGEELTLDFYGLAICECGKKHVYWPKDRTCHQIYLRGPCLEGELLAIDEKTRTIICRPNPCGRDGEVFWPPTQKCYILGEQGPCEDTLVLTVDEMTLELTCVGLDLRNIFHVPLNSCAVGSRRDYFQQCRGGLVWSNNRSESEFGKYLHAHRHRLHRLPVP
ncbi:unnamed protein product [Notodromas monacha]|uniref:DUF4789 domain-containing protein n=1 Tax=Notodromas monacha TaxID=399045 RepID=A0A7R9BSX6_9CRUS|nr:unnamed protein product [Notodromas monacha]CAG0920812.1 unnamed protein product [Notodromas monacha]